MVARYLRSLGYRVTYVRNVTDVDDKIIARAAENGEHFSALTRRFTEAMHEDCRALGVLEPDVEPRATQYIGPIVSMVERLIESGAAYCGANGDVYYDVSTFPAYGALSDRRIEDLRSGARVEIDEAKDDPLDFVLWKASKPGEPSWGSPWGPGRPGWHIECSAMSTACLGDHFDIHGGGMDLQFPHHENEIAQSEAATGGKFVNVWMHNGFVRIDDEKMSKSLGNFFTVRGVLERYPAEAVRFFMLSSHYRSPLNYSEDQLRQADAALRRLYTALRGLGAASGEPDAEWLAALPCGDGRRLQHPGGALGALRSRPRAQPRARVGGGGPGGRPRGRVARTGRGARPPGCGPGGAPARRACRRRSKRCRDRVDDRRAGRGAGARGLGRGGSLARFARRRGHPSRRRGGRHGLAPRAASRPVAARFDPGELPRLFCRGDEGFSGQQFPLTSWTWWCSWNFAAFSARPSA